MLVHTPFKMFDAVATVPAQVQSANDSCTIDELMYVRTYGIPCASGQTYPTYGYDIFHCPQQVTGTSASDWHSAVLCDCQNTKGKQPLMPSCQPKLRLSLKACAAK